MEFKRAIPHTVTIQPTDNSGFQVQVGCVTLAYPSSMVGIEALIDDLKQYLIEPKAVIKAYNTTRNEFYITEVPGETPPPQPIHPDSC